MKLNAIEAEIINAKNKIYLHERILKRGLPELYTEEESKSAESAVLDVARRYQELTDAMQDLIRENKMDEAQELGWQLRMMTGNDVRGGPRAIGGGKRNKKSKKRKSKRRKSKTRRRSR